MLFSQLYKWFKKKRKKQKKRKRHETTWTAENLTHLKHDFQKILPCNRLGCLYLSLTLGWNIHSPRHHQHFCKGDSAHTRSLFSMLDSLPLVAARCLVPVRPAEGGSPSKSSHPLVLLSSFSFSFSCISPSNGLLPSLHLSFRLSLTICPSSPPLSLSLVN